MSISLMDNLYQPVKGVVVISGGKGTIVEIPSWGDVLSSLGDPVSEKIVVKSTGTGSVGGIVDSPSIV